MSSLPPIKDPTQSAASNLPPVPTPKLKTGDKAHHIPKLKLTSGNFKFKLWKSLSGKLPDFLMRRLSLILVKTSLVPSIPKEKMTALSLSLLKKMEYSDLADLNLQQFQKLEPRLKNLDTATFSVLFSAQEGKGAFDLIEQAAVEHLQKNIAKIKDDQIKIFFDRDSKLRSLYVFLNRNKTTPNSDLDWKLKRINSNLCRRFVRSFKDRIYEADGALKEEIEDASQMRGNLPFTVSKRTFDYEGKQIPLIQDFEIDIPRMQEYVINHKVFGNAREDVSKRVVPNKRKVLESLYLAAGKDPEVFKQLQQVLYQGSFQPFFQIASDKYILVNPKTGPLMMMDVRKRSLEVNTLNKNEWIFKYSIPDNRIKDIFHSDNFLIKLNITAEIHIHPEDFKKGDYSKAQIIVRETFS